MAAPQASMRANSGNARMYKFMMCSWKKHPHARSLVPLRLTSGGSANYSPTTSQGFLIYFLIWHYHFAGVHLQGHKSSYCMLLQSSTIDMCCQWVYYFIQQSYTGVVSIFCPVVKCWEEKLNINVYWVSGSMKWSVLRGTPKSTQQPCRVICSQLLSTSPAHHVSWGHTSVGQVPVKSAISTDSSRRNRSDPTHPRLDAQKWGQNKSIGN